MKSNATGSFRNGNFKSNAQGCYPARSKTVRYVGRLRFRSGGHFAVRGARALLLLPLLVALFLPVFVHSQNTLTLVDSKREDQGPGDNISDAGGIGVPRNIPLDESGLMRTFSAVAAEEAAVVTTVKAAPTQTCIGNTWIRMGDGLWQDPQNWSLKRVPGVGPGLNDDVCIGAGRSVTFSSPGGLAMINRLTCNGNLTITNGARLEFKADSQIDGTLTLGSDVPEPSLGTLLGVVDSVPQVMTIAGAFNWFGGALSGDGVFNANGGITISGVMGKELRGPTLNNPGTATWSGKGNIAIGGRFNNTGTFDANNDAQFFLQGAAQGFFNEGKFYKLDSAGTTSFSVPFHNTGTVVVNSGTLELRGGGTSTGLFGIRDKCFVKFTAGTYNLNGATIGGMGHGVVDGAFVTVSGKVSAGNFEVASRNLAGAGTLSVYNLRWTGGSMTGTGVTDARVTLEISGDADKVLESRTLNNAGTATWKGTGNIGMGNGAVFNNTGTFNAENNAKFTHTGGTPASFNNQGNFNKRGAKPITFFPNVAFNNTGTVTVEFGDLELRGGGTTTQPGAFDARRDAEVKIAGGTYTLDNAAFFGEGRFHVNGGTVEVRGTVGMSRFILSSGTLTGAGTLDVFGDLGWTGGTMGGSGVTNADGRMFIDGYWGKTLRQRTLNTRGDVTWTGPANIGMEAGAVFNNFGGFTAENNQTFVGAGPSSGSFNNFGVFTKSAGIGIEAAGVGITRFEIPFFNTGVVGARSGKIVFARGFDQKEGETTIDAGGSIGGSLNVRGGHLRGDGSHTGNIDNSGGTASPGRSPGRLNIVGNYTQGAAGVLEIEIAGPAPGTQFDQLNVSATATLGGTLTIAFLDGFTPDIGDTFTFLLSGSRAGSFRQVNFPNITGRAFNIIYNLNNVMLEVVSPVPVTVPTPAGSNVRVQAGDVTVTFDNVTQSGTTTVNPIDPNSAGPPPVGYTLPANTPAYEITTTAIYSGQITVDVRLPYDIQPNRPRLALLHGEPLLIDRTIATNDLSKLSARVLSLSPFVIAQTESCISSISSAVGSFAAAGGNGALNVTAPSDCSWTAESNDSWIMITSGSGTGGGTVSYAVAANSSTSIRSGSISISGQRLTVLQGAAFLDVAEAHPFYTEIGKLSARGVTLDCGSGNYCPDATVTREQMAAFIIRALGDFNPPPPARQRFNDVPLTNPFYAFIEEMAVRQIMLGCGSGNYCPGQPVTHEQMAAFIIRVLGEFSPETPTSQRFDDVPPSNPFYAFIDRMAVRGITLGCSASPPLYCPGQAVTRGQMAAFLVRAFGL